MATDQLMAPLPQIDLQPGMKVVLEAIDPTTGLAVAGVTVSKVAVYGTTTTTGPDLGLGSGPFMLVPGPES